ncbi:MAG: RNA 2',3'-cyclic phosphodiesterase [Acidobacteria bacterium]|nr:RNA 2',3'-cyclic phosphodiesterase [Acidobacteriota bacterium]
MRLFVAIELSEETRQALQAVVDELRPRLPLRWVAAENWHLTLKFIGEWPAECRCDIVSVLRSVKADAPIRFVLEGLGVLPNIRSPRVFWAGLRHGERLPELTSRVDEALAALGVEQERRAFKPHITLGRLKTKIRPAELQRAIDNYRIEFGSLTTDRFVLFQSELRPGGAVYRKVEEFVFAEENP